jgi:hypothetical protein
MNRTTSLLHAAVAALLMASPVLAADAPKAGEKPAELLQPAKPFEALPPPQPTNIQWTKTVLSKEFFSEGAAAGDFNKDGKMDVASGPYWYEGPDFSPEKRHAFYEPKVFNPLQYSDNFLAYAHDFNGDGWDDILVYGFPGKEAWIFENPKTPAGQKQGPWKRHTALASVDNESPGFADINGDGKPDIICSTGGFLGYATADWNNPFQPWTFHKISPKGPWQRFTHGLGVGDVNGDGKMDLLEKDGWWEQPADLAGDPVWKKHDVKFGNGGAQMYAYDVNGDGKNDVITSIAAHGYGLAWFEQSADGTFTPHLIMGQKPEENVQRMKISQLHAIDLVDIDGDGLKDIVTGKRWWAHGPKGDAEPDAAAVITWFRLVRDGGKARFDGHVIDTDSGIGTQVMAIDLNGDKKPDVVVGNKRGTFVHIQSTKPGATARRD